MDEKQLIKTIRQFVSSEDKPKGCQPIDVLQTIRLFVQQASDEPKVSIARGTLAAQLGCSERTIYQSQQRLQKFGWVDVQKGKRGFRANEFTVLTDSLPLANDLKRTIVTDTARRFAVAYKQLVLQANPKRIFKTNSTQMFAFRIQTLLDKCDGDENRVADLVIFAFGHPAFRPKAIRGPHELRKCWKSLRMAYDTERQEAAPQPTARSVQAG